MVEFGRGRIGGRFTVVRGDVAGLRLCEVPEGKVSGPAHHHTIDDEKFVVLDGSGEVRLGADRHALRTGSIVVRPADSGVEHVLYGGSLTYLAWGTNRPGDVCVYPDSNKLLVAGAMFRVEPLEYWDGEA
jgi:uncharacterized cupin superfamily protein